ncbi:hypothetical protein F0562_035990 [Nyssa sinensis]|uniref:Uncharacterized protein n=1 Tax=Nyssa sinensis TaxID=561372 RepID=A0A5J5AC84_9ASTE|nr:hypothetical protein F0562_035990 [Nyssa sinensis]
MEDEEAQTTTAPKREGSDGGGVLGKGRYKFWALAAIILLAFWSMLTGSVTLKWTAGNLNPISDHFDSPIHDDLDVLEVKERERLVRHMWDIYTHSSSIRLPRFWQEAFEAAYEDLTSDVAGVRNAAVSEIAKMSLMSVDVDRPPVQSTNTREGRNIPKKAEEDKKAVGAS